MNNTKNENVEEDKKIKMLLKSVKTEKTIVKVLYMLTYIIIVGLEVVVFKKGIKETTLISVISLGAIFSTFGSSLAAISLVLENDKYDRILRNVDVFFRDIACQDPWRRWQFLPRESNIKNLDSTRFTTTLTNPNVEFDVGSHKIEISIPTVREDFYDLPAFRYFFKMYFNRKHFFTNTSNKKNWDKHNGFMGWTCIYDIWKNVMIYRFSRYLLKIGVSIIFTSIALTLYFSIK